MHFKIKMKKLLGLKFAIILLIISTQTFAQESKRERGRGVYMELFGNGLGYSFNYDQRFDKRFDGLGFKGGISYFAFNGSSVAAFPFGLNYLLGKDGKYFEMGLGATYLRFADSSNTFSVGNERTIGDGLAGNMIFGYRREPEEGGFLFRASMTPLFGQGTFFPFWFGISLGYAF
jgi:hypothetical protein